jgi:5-methyltetrahydrofolate--homocysteine methyltransferase
MINSISQEKERYEKLMLVVAETLVNGLLKNNVKMENTFEDPLVQPVLVNNTFGMDFINAIEKIVTTFEGIYAACGLSNNSFGLPARKFMNQIFMVMAIAKGLDGVIINPLDRQMMSNIIAAEALAGRDNFCMGYLKAYRAGMFEK